MTMGESAGAIHSLKIPAAAFFLNNGAAPLV